MAGNAAAVCGARNGKKMVPGLGLGKERYRVVSSTDEAVNDFKTIFRSAPGTSFRKFRKALELFSRTKKCSKYDFAEPTDQDVDFMAKVADTDKNGTVSEEEAAFAFRVWLCWHKLNDRIRGLYDTLDSDGNGQLDANELKPYLVDLNGGEEVSYPEVWSIIRRADANGDCSLDLAELTFATAVWYADIAGRKVMEMARARDPEVVKKARASINRASIKLEASKADMYARFSGLRDSVKNSVKEQVNNKVYFWRSASRDSDSKALLPEARSRPSDSSRSSKRTTNSVRSDDTIITFASHGQRPVYESKGSGELKEEECAAAGSQPASEYSVAPHFDGDRRPNLTADNLQKWNKSYSRTAGSTSTQEPQTASGTPSEARSEELGHPSPPEFQMNASDDVTLMKGPLQVTPRGEHEEVADMEIARRRAWGHKRL